MRNADAWIPCKFVHSRGRLIASPDPREVGIGSRLIANVIAGVYDTNLRLHARGRLLDLGCGKVPLYASYRALASEIVCVDWAHSMHRNHHLDYELDLTQALPFESGRFDTIVLSDVLEHIAEPDKLWAEMARLLAPGGRILINVPFLYWLHEQPHDYYRYTEFALRRFATLHRLDVLQLEPVGGAPEVVTDIFSKCALLAPRIGRSLAAGAQWVTLRFIRTSLGRRISEATCRDFPLGYFMVVAKPAVPSPA